MQSFFISEKYASYVCIIIKFIGLLLQILAYVHTYMLPFTYSTTWNNMFKMSQGSTASIPVTVVSYLGASHTEQVVAG